MSASFSSGYIEDHSATGKGIGVKFGLEKLNAIERQPQKGQNCSTVSANMSFEIALAVKHIQQQYATRDSAASMAQAELAEFICAGIEASRRDNFKPFRDQLRLQGVKSMIAAGENGTRAKLSAKAHLKLMQDVIRFCYHKIGGTSECDGAMREKILGMIFEFAATPERCSYSIEQVNSLHNCKMDCDMEREIRLSGMPRRCGLN